jgi:hypothetical protein
VPRWFALVLCAFGAALLATGLRQSARGRDTRGWTRADGRILESRVEVHEPDENHERRFGFVIRYAYEARGVRHASEQIWIGSSAASVSEDEARIRRWVERFPEGTDVPVWFDPRDPRQAVLVQGVPAVQVRALLAAGAVLVGVGVFALGRAVTR